KIAEYILIARRNGTKWYVGAMTDWTPREMSVDLSFLGAGSFEMTSYQDGPNADRNATDYKLSKRTVTAAEKLTIKLAPGGGWAAVLSPVK
ncbi:MAG: hypothetical protein FJY80_13395, partial [Candidatus Aminicenantes bacterium]|nr:hypothetical protein [Candidatus Aminicenantes bacterium]